jgi:hypothetical protein
MCKMSAVNLAGLADMFESRGGRIIGLSYEETCKEEFLEETKWRHELLVDETSAAYKGLQLEKAGCSQCWGLCVCCSSVGGWLSKSDKLGFKNNTAGGWLQRGGTVLLAGPSGSVMYEHKQTADDFEPNTVAIMDKLEATDAERAAFKGYKGLDEMK